MSPENTASSPWPAVSSLPMSAWPIPKNVARLNPAFRNTKWKVNSAASSGLSRGNFQPERNQRSSKMNNIDQLAAKLLTLSDQPKSPLEEGYGSSESDKISPRSSRSSPELSGRSNSDLGPGEEAGGQTEADLRPEGEAGGPNSRFKTEICRNFKEKGHCLYGELCQFAHGKEEMRNVGQHSKYKTQRCLSYWLLGYCGYGPRCNFLHYEEKDPSGQLVKLSRTEKTEKEPSPEPAVSHASLPPTPVPLGELYRPTVGSGRLAALSRGGELHWIDIRTQSYV